jgi:type I restriction enzyme R subunit
VAALCKVANRKEIEAQGWSLNPGRYVGATAGEEVRDADFKEQFEELTEEELAIFDILTKPRVDITAKEEKQVKKVAKDMLATLKAKALVLDWRKRQQTRAAVRLCIEEWLDKLPPVYTSALYQTKCDAVYQHAYDVYGGGQSWGTGGR